MSWWYRELSFIQEVIRMINENEYIESENSSRSKESFMVQITNPMLYDRLHTLSVEYSVSVELLVNAAVKRFIEDVDFVRGLRTGKIDFE